MYKLFLMDTFEPLEHFDHYFGGLLQWKSLSGKFGLVGEEVAHLAVLHNDDDEVVG